MRVLLTGASSFTGYWFARELAADGHELVMTLRRDANAYHGIRGARVQRLAGLGRCIYRCDFGDNRFLEVIKQSPEWNLLAQHAAEANNYRSMSFDAVAALKNNTRNLGKVVRCMTDLGCRHVLLTGSLFEPGEGAGSEGLPAFSPYGLSKGLTAQTMKYYVQKTGMRLGKFVIPNPFGPFEEQRFTYYLMRSWYEGKTPEINSPSYVRDNIHVSLLAKAYVVFAKKFVDTHEDCKFNPAGYIETQGAFANRFASQMRPRLGLDCSLTLKEQSEFPEPRIRINTEPLDYTLLAWDESAAWDELASYYQRLFAVTP